MNPGTLTCWQIETVSVLRFQGTISDSSVCCWINVLPYRQTLISVQPLMFGLLPDSLVFFWVTDSGWKRQSQNQTCSSSKFWSSPFFPFVFNSYSGESGRPEYKCQCWCSVLLCGLMCEDGQLRRSFYVFSLFGIKLHFKLIMLFWRTPQPAAHLHIEQTMW